MRSRALANTRILDAPTHGHGQQLTHNTVADRKHGSPDAAAFTRKEHSRTRQRAVWDREGEAQSRCEMPLWYVFAERDHEGSAAS
jgi:hypothetical protein